MASAPFRIALSGKGGTGKTTTAALLIDAFRRMAETPILAVDADPNANLHEALGMEVTESLGSMREEAFTKAIPPGMSRHDYVRLRFRQVLVEGTGVDLIAMGRPEGTGCYCFSNDLLSECLADLQAEYKFIVIDAEAGMEHIARGTIGVPDLLLIVSDPGARGMRTATRIRDIGLSLGLERERMALVVNRVRDGVAEVGGEPVPVIAEVPADPAIEVADLEGRPIAGIPADSPARLALTALAEQIRRCAAAR